MTDSVQADRQALKARFGEETVIVDNEHGLFVFSKPSKAAWSKCFNAMAQDDRRVGKDSITDQLARDCLVYPEKDGKPDQAKLHALLEDMGALSQTLMGELGDLIGAGPRHAVTDKETKSVIAENAHGRFLFSKPGKLAWSRYLNAMARDDRKSDKVAISDQFARDCLAVSPNGAAALNALLEDMPGISQTIAGELAGLAGAGHEHVGKL